MKYSKWKYFMVLVVKATTNCHSRQFEKDELSPCEPQEFLSQLWLKTLNILPFHTHLHQQNIMANQTFEYQPPLPKKYNSTHNLNEIGVGVYRGELVVFGHHVLDISSPDALAWEVCTPNRGHLEQIDPVLVKQLCWAACVLLSETQSCLSLKDSQRKNGTLQLNNFRHIEVLPNCVPPSSDVNNSVSTQQSQQIKQCPLIEKMILDLESQKLSCPKYNSQSSSGE